MYALIYERTPNDILVLEYGTKFDCEQEKAMLEESFARECEIVPAWYSTDTKEVEF